MGSKKNLKMAPMATECYLNIAFFFKWFMHGKAMPYAIVSNNISGTHGNLKGSQLVNSSDKPLFGIGTTCALIYRETDTLSEETAHPTVYRHLSQVSADIHLYPTVDTLSEQVKSCSSVSCLIKTEPLEWLRLTTSPLYLELSKFQVRPLGFTWNLD